MVLTGLFSKSNEARPPQEEYAESVFYQNYAKFSKRNDEYVETSDMHAHFAELQYLRSLEDAVAKLSREVQALREEIRQNGRRQD